MSGRDTCELVTFSLYVNGFAFVTPDHFEASASLSPFSLVRNVRFQTENYAKMLSFKIALDHEHSAYFAAGSAEDPATEDMRSDWVLGISHTILLITDSILPALSLTCDPVPGLPHTARRLLAGYVVHQDDPCSASVLYCQLSVHTGQYALLHLYENELCQAVVHEIVLGDSSHLDEVIGINCTRFVVDVHQFACQTPSERKLWLRAMGNVKVKLANCAPDPTEEELLHYRKSVRENIRAIQATTEPTLNSEALLTQCAYRGDERVRSGDRPSSHVGDEAEATQGKVRTAWL